MVDLVRQRIYQIAAGYEDTNDATFLRNDPAMRAVVGRVERPLASQPTLSRLENSAEWDAVRLLEGEGLEWFCRVGSAIDGRRRDSVNAIDRPGNRAWSRRTVGRAKPRRAVQSGGQSISRRRIRATARSAKRNASAAADLSAPRR